MSKILAVVSLEGFIRTPGRGDPPDNTDTIQFMARLLTTCGGILCDNFVIEISNTFSDEAELRSLLATSIANKVNDRSGEGKFTLDDVVLL